MNGNLYLVATPIGNLEDITFRAIKILKQVDVIAAEDTRYTLRLLNYYQISKPLISYHRHNEEIKTEMLIDKLLKGEDIAVVTDAGTPAISDPGEVIVKAAIEHGISIIPIPGACAFVNALIASGLNTKEFSFYGFLPLNKKLRKEAIDKIKKENKTVILYEAPHKLKKTLEDLVEDLGNVYCVLAKEITKVHEKFERNTISNLLLNLPEEIKGEYIILLDLNNTYQETNKIENMEIKEQYVYYEKNGLDKKEIIKQIAKNKNVSKNEIYQLFLDK